MTTHDRGIRGAIAHPVKQSGKGNLRRSAGLAAVALCLSGWTPAEFVPVRVALAAQPDQHVYDLSARLQMIGGDGCPCLNLRFTNLGPSASTAFNFQVTQQKWIVGQKRYGAVQALNAMADGAVPLLAPARDWQKNYNLNLESGSRYLFKIKYSPTINDANNANHNIELTFTLP